MVTEFTFVMLRDLKLNVREIHSRKPQLYRTRISDEFRESNRLILITSDVTARGVNYPDVTLVIQVNSYQILPSLSVSCLLSNWVLQISVFFFFNSMFGLCCTNKLRSPLVGAGIYLLNDSCCADCTSAGVVWPYLVILIC